jgi:hypothetical protein
MRPRTGLSFTCTLVCVSIGSHLADCVEFPQNLNIWLFGTVYQLKLFLLLAVGRR